jgi:curved DNA-binding protein CbpA
MDAKKDYYATLGVLPSAEDIVVRAAYKALAQRYHPDRNPGVIAEATRRMAEINEAFEILSDATKRKEYDAQRNSKQQSADAYFEESEEQSSFADPMDPDWQVAVGFFPDLEDLRKQLRKISLRLDFTYRAVLLDTKGFDKRKELASKMEQEFLKLYFGDDPEILHFARRVIDMGNKPAAKALNNAVRVLGKSVSATQVIKKVAAEHLPRGRNGHEFSGAEAINFLNTVRIGKLLDIETLLADNPLLVEAKNSDGETALHIAVDEGSLSKVELLLRHNADHQTKTIYGETPLDVAKRIGFGRKGVAEVLANLG